MVITDGPLPEVASAALKADGLSIIEAKDELQATGWERLGAMVVSSCSEYIKRGVNLSVSKTHSKDNYSRWARMMMLYRVICLGSSTMYHFSCELNKTWFLIQIGMCKLCSMLKKRYVFV